MLTRLIIRNYAIIPELDVYLQPGLTIITGETGAGKSILLGALGLALGKRAELNVVASSKAKCTIEAHFQLKNEQLKSFFEREGLDYEPLMICRREIGTDGRSRSFINDTPVSLKILQEATDPLIELHHQNDNLALQSNEYQIRSLDVISGAQNSATEYSKQYNTLQVLKNEFIQLKEL